MNNVNWEDTKKVSSNVGSSTQTQVEDPEARKALKEGTWTCQLRPINSNQETGDEFEGLLPNFFCTDKISVERSIESAFSSRLESVKNNLRMNTEGLNEFLNKNYPNLNRVTWVFADPNIPYVFECERQVKVGKTGLAPLSTEKRKELLKKFSIKKEESSD